MQQTCLKCGHEHTAVNDLPAIYCPQCGAVYAKVEQAVAARVAALEKAVQAATKPAIGAGSSPWLGAIVAVALVLGAYFFYARAPIGFWAQDREQKRAGQHDVVTPEQMQALAAQRRGEPDQSAAAAAQERAKAAEQRAQEEAAKRAAMTPGQIRREKLNEQFSGWDGSHRAAEQAIQALMHNPKSYEHVSTTYVDHGAGRGITVRTRFRGTNAFNAVITNRATVEVNAAGQVTSVKIDP